MNGDRYPDQVQRKKGANELKVKFNEGGIGFGRSETFSHTLGENINESTNASISLGLSLPNLKGKDPDTTLYESDASGFSVKAKKFISGLGGGYTYGTSITKYMLMDINGDGLPDHVNWNKGNNTIKVRLNLGDNFSSKEENWKFAKTINVWDVVKGDAPRSDLKNTVLPGSNGEGFNYSTTSTGYVSSGGLTGSFAVTRTEATFVDINGDGLPDYVTKSSGSNYFLVAFNTGTSFGEAVKYYVPGWESSPSQYFGSLLNTLKFPTQSLKPLVNGDIVGYSGNFSVSANGSLKLGIPVIFLTITFGLGASLGTTSGYVSMMDINGDGLVDHVFKNTGNNKIQARVNGNGKTNLLKKVNGPLGYTLTFDYERKGNTKANPNSSYVLSKTTVINGVTTTEGKTEDKYTTNYEYGAGKYDRDERVPYGYKSVKETRPDGSSSFTKYHNDSYHMKGLAYYNEVRAKDGFVYRKNETTYELKNEVVISGKLLSAFPAATIQKTYYYEKSGGPKINEVNYEYDEYANITREIDYGDDKIASDDTDLLIDYKYDPGIYSMGKPEEVTVRNRGKILRKRRAGYDAKGNLTSFEVYLASKNKWAKTEIGYNNEGNIVRLTDPNNYEIFYNYDNIVKTHIVKVTDSFGYKSLSEYDYKLGTVIRVTDLNGNFINYKYDSFGRTKKVWGPYLDPATDNLGTLSMEYYLIRVKKVSYAAGNVILLNKTLFFVNIRQNFESAKIIKYKL
ncbi:MAG: toxin TcdB middle/N-terminal domain-containing protein [Leptospirales bacterium]